MDMDSVQEEVPECLSKLPASQDDHSLEPNSPSSSFISRKQGISSTASMSVHFSHISSSLPYAQSSNKQAGAVISQIEDTVRKMVDCMTQEKKELVIHLKSRPRAGTQTLDPVTGAISNFVTKEARPIKFPGKTPQEAWRFSR